MKKWVLYIMSAVFCMGFFACTAEDDLTDNSAGKSNEENVLVSFNLNTPSARTSSTDELDSSPYQWERYIGQTDIRVLVFKENIYQEEVKGLFLKGNDSDEIRTFTGRITNSYNGSKVNLVVLTGMKSRNVNMPQLTSGKTIVEDIYKGLIFNYDEAWSFYADETKHIPMWGKSNDFSINAGQMNDAGEITMYRAVAKIDILINGGKGLDDFKVNKIEICYPSLKGYCASLNSLKENAFDQEGQFRDSSVPTGAANTSTTFEIYSLKDGNEIKNSFENEIYVPETSINSGFRIKLFATITNPSGDETKEYSILMREVQGDGETRFQLIRNHHYIFNINSFTQEGLIKFNYQVVHWGKSDIYFPGFE